MTVNPDKAGPFAINVRIPGWARDEAAPGGLYRFLDPVEEPVTLKVNGRPVPLKIEKGYVSLRRNWKKGDVIALTLPMPVRRIVANDQVAADRGRVALQRGPVVYCAEWPDNPDGHVRNLLLPDSAKLLAEFRPDLLGGVTLIKSRSLALSFDAEGKTLQKEQAFTAIPYYAWANRGRGEMTVWIPNNEANARPQPFPTIATTSKVTVSSRRDQRLDPRRINDGEEPASSSDSGSYFDWWPTKGSTEWVEYAFEKTGAVSQVEVYWFDDTGRGEVRIPLSWRVLYKDGDEWKPVENAGPYGVEKDRYNQVSFKPVTTIGLRLEIVMQPNWSAGLQEWKVK
jgi:hypothetical protein